MSTFTAILDPDADGSIHLPLPPSLRDAPVRVTATLEAATSASRPVFGCLRGKVEMAPDFDEPLDDFRDYM